MAVHQVKRTLADDEAAAWLTQLGTRTVSLETLHAFAAWRERPENAEAYRRAEQLWSKAGDLADDPDIQAALLQAEARKPARLKGSQTWLAPLAAGVCALAVAGGFFFLHEQGVYRTGVGEQRIVQLADGSTLRLDTASKVRVRLSQDRRQVRLLEGQALFEVAHDSARPFVVSTADASVTAVGTVFEVRRDGDGTRVVLVSGAVDVVPIAEASAAPRRLQPDQQAVVEARGARLEPVNAEAATSWTEGKLTFVDTPLKEAVAEVNRYLARPIVLDAPAVEKTTVNGVFRSGDRDAFVAATAQLLGLRPVRERDGVIRLVGPKNNVQAG